MKQCLAWEYWIAHTTQPWTATPVRAAWNAGYIAAAEPDGLREALDVLQRIKANATPCRGDYVEMHVGLLAEIDRALDVAHCTSGACRCQGCTPADPCGKGCINPCCRALGVADRQETGERWVTHNVTDPDWHPGGGHWHPHRAGPELIVADSPPEETGWVPGPGPSGLKAPPPEEHRP